MTQNQEKDKCVSKDPDGEDGSMYRGREDETSPQRRVKLKDNGMTLAIYPR